MDTVLRSQISSLSSSPVPPLLRLCIQSWCRPNHVYQPLGCYLVSGNDIQHPRKEFGESYEDPEGGICVAPSDNRTVLTIESHAPPVNNNTIDPRHKRGQLSPPTPAPLVGGGDGDGDGNGDGDGDGAAFSGEFSALAPSHGSSEGGLADALDVNSRVGGGLRIVRHGGGHVEGNGDSRHDFGIRRSTWEESGSCRGSVGEFGDLRGDGGGGDEEEQPRRRHSVTGGEQRAGGGSGGSVGSVGSVGSGGMGMVSVTTIGFQSPHDVREGDDDGSSSAVFLALSLEQEGQEDSDTKQGNRGRLGHDAGDGMVPGRGRSLDPSSIEAGGGGGGGSGGRIGTRGERDPCGDGDEGVVSEHSLLTHSSVAGGGEADYDGAQYEQDVEQAVAMFDGTSFADLDDIEGRGGGGGGGRVDGTVGGWERRRDHDNSLDSGTSASRGCGGETFHKSGGAMMEDDRRSADFGGTRHNEILFNGSSVATGGGSAGSGVDFSDHRHTADGRVDHADDNRLTGGVTGGGVGVAWGSMRVQRRLSGDETAELCEGRGDGSAEGSGGGGDRQDGSGDSRRKHDLTFGEMPPGSRRGRSGRGGGGVGAGSHGLGKQGMLTGPDLGLVLVWSRESSMTSLCT